MRQPFVVGAPSGQRTAFQHSTGKLCKLISSTTKLQPPSVGQTSKAIAATASALATSNHFEKSPNTGLDLNSLQPTQLLEFGIVSVLTFIVQPRIVRVSCSAREAQGKRASFCLVYARLLVPERLQSGFDDSCCLWILWSAAGDAFFDPLRKPARM